MADGNSLNDLNTQENKSSSPTLMAAEGAEGGNRSSSTSDMSNIAIDEVVTVPNVEVKHAPFQSQPNLRGDLTAEQVKELGQKMRKEQAKKYFSLRVRMSFLFLYVLNKLNLQDKLTCSRKPAGLYFILQNVLFHFCLVSHCLCFEYRQSKSISGLFGNFSLLHLY